jgi:hypothetical protein
MMMKRPAVIGFGFKKSRRADVIAANPTATMKL